MARPQLLYQFSKDYSSIISNIESKGKQTDRKAGTALMGFYGEAQFAAAMKKRQTKDFQVTNLLDTNQEQAVIAFETGKSNWFKETVRSNIQAGTQRAVNAVLNQLGKDIQNVTNIEAGSAVGDVAAVINGTQFVFELKTQFSETRPVHWFKLQEDSLFGSKAFSDWITNDQKGVYWTYKRSKREWQQDITNKAFPAFIHQYDETNTDDKLLHFVIQKGHALDGATEAYKNATKFIVYMHGKTGKVSMQTTDQLIEHIGQQMQYRDTIRTDALDGGVGLYSAQHELLLSLTITNYQKKKAERKGKTLHKGQVDTNNIAFTFESYINQKLFMMDDILL